MGLSPTDNSATDQPPSRLDYVVECLLVALFAFMPFAFGAVEAWAEEVVVVLSGAMIVCLLLSAVVRRKTGLVWTWAYIPLGLFLVLAVVQLLPLPCRLLAAFTPNTIATRAGLAEGLSQPTPAPGGVTISFYPLATERALRLALAVSAVFVATVNVYRKTGRIKRLLGIIAAIGGAVALLALVQIATGARKAYWCIPAVSGAGPFINRNNYSQFMNLSMGAALALLLITLRDRFRRTPVSLEQVLNRMGSREMRPVWCLSGMIVLGVASVFLSLSRGGMISLLAAWAVTIVVLGMRKRLDASNWIMCVLALCALICVIYVGFDSVYDRLASLWRLQAYEGRWQLLRDSARAWAMFPLLGVGLGAHEYVYPMFDQSTIVATATHVENEYVQMGEETGLIGLILIGAFGTVIFRSFLQCIRERRSPVGIAAVGLGTGLLAVLIHSTADFGLHVPANACLAAACCGLVVAAARAGRPTRESRPGRFASGARGFSAVALAAVVAAFTWAAVTADGSRRAEKYWRRAQRLERGMGENGWAVSNKDCTRLIELAGEAVRLRPRNVLYRYWHNAHRWRAVSRVADPHSGTVFFGSGALRTANEIIADLEYTRTLCPTFGPAYSLAGQLRRFILGDRRGNRLIRRGRSLAPCDPAACVADGMLEAHEGNTAASLAAFRRALALRADWFPYIVNVYVLQISRPDLAVEIAQGDAGRLLAVAETLEAQQRGPLAGKARRDALSLLSTQCEASSVPARMLVRTADLCLQSQEPERAAAYYRRALSRECGNVTWRLNFATILAEMGRAPEAWEQAQICLKLRPGMPEAHALIRRMRSRSGHGRDAN